MDKNESKFPEDLVNVRVQANTSYQIKRVMELVETEKGLEMMSCSKILKNTGTGPRLRQFATFKDLKHEKKANTISSGIAALQSTDCRAVFYLPFETGDQ